MAQEVRHKNILLARIVVRHQNMRRNCQNAANTLQKQAKGGYQATCNTSKRKSFTTKMRNTSYLRIDIPATS